jgi:F1F0 ATPase subunit 2
MADTPALVAAGLAGGLLGALFFGGLWWTIGKGVSSPRPAFWFLASLVLRIGVVLAGLYLVGRGHPQRLLACLAGFVVAQSIASWRMRPQREARDRRQRKAIDAPQP